MKTFKTNELQDKVMRLVKVLNPTYWIIAIYFWGVYQLIVHLLLQA